MPWYAKILLLSQPLHFGDYGGLPLKIIWAILDLMTIVVLGSGLYLWWHKWKKPAAPRPCNPRRLDRKSFEPTYLGPQDFRRSCHSGGSQCGGADVRIAGRWSLGRCLMDRTCRADRRAVVFCSISARLAHLRAIRVRRQVADRRADDRARRAQGERASADVEHPRGARRRGGSGIGEPRAGDRELWRCASRPTRC